MAPHDGKSTSGGKSDNDDFRNQKQAEDSEDVLRRPVIELP